MSEPVHTHQARPASDAGSRADSVSGSLSADTFETSRLLLELIHAAYSTRGADASPAPDNPGRTQAPSTHAIRAAIHLYQHGERTVGQLATGLGISLGWASRVVSELEADGLTQRRVDPGDRRVVIVALTPAATDLVEREYRWRGDVVEQALASLDHDGRQAVMAFLRRVAHELAQPAEELRQEAR